MVDHSLRNQAYEAYVKRDVAGLIILVSSQKHTIFLEENIHSFLHAGFYEEALFESMTGGSNCLPDRWSNFLAYADLEKLRSIGDPIPKKPITVCCGVAYFGGVVGCNGEIYCAGDEVPEDLDIDYELGDFVRGYSWTLNIHTAAWFANRLSGKGAVYYAKIKPDDILFCNNGRGEEEVVVDISKLPSVLRGLRVIPEPIKPKSV